MPLDLNDRNWDSMELDCIEKKLSLLGIKNFMSLMIDVISHQ